MLKIIKRKAEFLLSMLLILSLCACGTSADSKGSESTVSDVQEESIEESSAPQESAEPESSETAQTSVSEETEPTEGTQSEEDSAGSDILVVYFSRTGEQYTVGVIEEGNTAIVAKMIAEQTGADLFEILPVDDHYPMTYAELTDVAKQEQNDQARPEYAGEVPDLTQYSTVFIGAPVWWGDWPMIMYTFFENNAEALSGKKLIPFSTHEGSGLSGFDRTLSSLFPDSTILDGLAIRGNDAQNQQDNVRNTVIDWINRLGL